MEPPVMGSEITRLRKLRGYLKSGNFVVRLRTEPLQLPLIAPGFVQRLISEGPGPLTQHCPSIAAGNRTSGTAEQSVKPEHTRSQQQKLKRSVGRGQRPFFE
jgi:hypothetical protein